MLNMSLKCDYYQRLDVERGSTKDQIKKAFLEKALVWHPDKAPDDEHKEQYETVYKGLQEAYRILTNDKERTQYDTALQKDVFELRDKDRDVGYGKSDKYKTDDGKFDVKQFTNDFDKTRSLSDKKKLDDLASQYEKEGAIKTHEFQEALRRRDEDLKQIDSQTAQIFAGAGVKFDVNMFNRAFDQVKRNNPTGVEEYNDIPRDMFSSTSLSETGLDLNYGFDLGGTSMDQLLAGIAENPALGALDLQSLNTGEKYGQESRMTPAEMQKLMQVAMNDRDLLARLGEKDFKIERSEVETQFASLYAPLEVERLEQPVVDRATRTLSPT